MLIIAKETYTCYHLSVLSAPRLLYTRAKDYEIRGTDFAHVYGGNPETPTRRTIAAIEDGEYQKLKCEDLVW